MNVTKPFRPLVLILIAVFLALTTGGLFLAGRQGREPAGSAIRVTASPAATVDVETSAATSTSTAVATPEATAAKAPTSVTSTPVTPTPRPEPSVTPNPTRAVVVTGWRRVQVDEAGVGLQVPENWVQADAGWAWSPDGSDDLQVGLVWVEPADDWTPGTMLPRAADLYGTEPVNLGWSQGTSYLVEVSGGRATVERHVVVRVDKALAVDFYARAGTTVELAALEPILDEILQSIIVNAYAGDPVDVSVQFLAALLSQGEPSSYLSTQLQQAVAGGRSILSLLGVDNLYSSFSVALVSAADGRMTVQADLDYGAGRVEERLLILVEQEGAWRIDDIAAPG